MKTLLTLLLAFFAFTSFAQIQGESLTGDIVMGKDGKSYIGTAAAAKADSLFVNGGDTLKIDLLQYEAFDKIRAIEQQRMEIQAQALVLQERSKGLDSQQGLILDGEYKHDKRYDPKKKVLSHQVVGTNLVIVLEKTPPAAKTEPVKKKK